MTDVGRIRVGMNKLLKDPYVWVLVVFVLIQVALLLAAGLGVVWECAGAEGWRA